MALHGDDDDYLMVTATCYIRLSRYVDAMKMLQQILDRNPLNYKALYHYSFCQRATGDQKDAIEGLTKVVILLDYSILETIVIINNTLT